MKLYYIRHKGSGAFLEWKRIVSHWVFSREEASHYVHKEAVQCVLESLVDENEDDPSEIEIEEIDMDAGQEALKILATLNQIRPLGDMIYQVRDSEGEGWDGPLVTAWGKACDRAEQLIKVVRPAEG